MIDFLIGVDGGGTGTRVRLARADGTELAQGASGPSGLALGIDRAWGAVREAVANAFQAAELPTADPAHCAIGLGLAGVHNKTWAADFVSQAPGFSALRLEDDGYTTLLGAHGGRPGVIIAIGTGSVGRAVLPGGTQREVGGWGFPAGDEASGAWIGLRAINHLQKVIDGRRAAGPLAHALRDACGRDPNAVHAWLAQGTQTRFASLAPIVVTNAPLDPTAREILEEAGHYIESMARTLDPSATLPLALCGGLSSPLREYLPPGLLARIVAPQGDGASGALHMIAKHIARP
jgi:glucosamine kinase